MELPSISFKVNKGPIFPTPLNGESMDCHIYIAFDNKVVQQAEVPLEWSRGTCQKKIIRSYVEVTLSNKKG